MKRTKVHIVYEARGVKNLYLKGYHISVEIFKNMSAMIIVHNKKGKQLQSIQLTKVYSIDRVIRRK